MPEATPTNEIDVELPPLVAARIAELTTERDEYRQLYLSLIERCRKLELGILGPKRERFVGVNRPLGTQNNPTAWVTDLF